MATTFERARWIAFERGWSSSRWVFVRDGRDLMGVGHVVLDELPDGSRGDRIWCDLLMVKRFTSVTVEGVIG